MDCLRDILVVRIRVVDHHDLISRRFWSFVVDSLCLINLGNLDRRLRQSMVFPIRVGVASTDSKNFFITSSFPDRCLRVGGDEVSTSMVFTASSFDVDA